MTEVQMMQTNDPLVLERAEARRAFQAQVRAALNAIRRAEAEEPIPEDERPRRVRAS